MPKCDFNKVSNQLYWNCTSAWVFYYKFAAYFQNTFSEDHLWRAASVFSNLKSIFLSPCWICYQKRHAYFRNQINNLFMALSNYINQELNNQNNSAYGHFSRSVTVQNRNWDSLAPHKICEFLYEYFQAVKRFHGRLNMAL